MHMFSVLLIVSHVLLCFCVLVVLHFYPSRDRYTVHCTLLPFRRWRSFYSREHIGASGRVWRSECLAQGGLCRIHILARRMKQTCSEKVAQHKIRVCYVSDCSEISFQMSEVFADCVLNCRRVVQLLTHCRTLSIGAIHLFYDFVYILKSFTDCDYRTSVRLVRWLLVVLHFYMFRDWYIVHSCQFSEKLELLYLRAHWCRRWIWKLKVLSSGCLEDLQSWSTHETDMFWKSGTTWRY